MITPIRNNLYKWKGSTIFPYSTFFIFFLNSTVLFINSALTFKALRTTHNVIIIYWHYVSLEFDLRFVCFSLIWFRFAVAVFFFFFHFSIFSLLVHFFDARMGNSIFIKWTSTKRESFFIISLKSFVRLVPFYFITLYVKGVFFSAAWELCWNF